MPYTGLKFWSKALDRAIRTFAQALLGVFGTGATGLLEADWAGALSIAAMAAIVSVLMSIATPDSVVGDTPIPADTEADPAGPLTD